MVANRQAGRGDPGRQLRLAFADATQRIQTVKAARKRAMEAAPAARTKEECLQKLLIRAEEGINSQLSSVHALDFLAYGRIFSIYKKYGFSRNPEFNASWPPTLREMPSKEDLAEVLAAITPVSNAVLRRVPASARLVGQQEKDAFFSTDHHKFLETVQELYVLVKEGKYFTAREKLNGLEAKHRASFNEEGESAEAINPYEMRAYLQLSHDGVIDAIGELAQSH